MISSTSSAGHAPVPTGAGSAPLSVEAEAWRAALQKSLAGSAAPGPAASASASALVEALVAHLQAPTAAPSLVLTALAPEAAMCFTEAVARAFLPLAATRPCGPVRQLHLPPRLTALPEGEAALPDLQCLVVPKFAGRQLDLRRHEPSLVSGRRVLQVVAAKASQLREILVLSPSAATECFSFKLSTLQQRKVVLVGTDDGKASRRPVPGHVYVREALGREHTDVAREAAFLQAHAAELNCVVPFEGRTALIECRHIAVVNAQRRVARRQAKAAAAAGGPPAEARFSYDHFADATRLKASVPWSTEQLAADLNSRARENHLVVLSEWDAFLRSQFATLAEGQSRVLLVGSTNHLMDVELQVKARPGGLADWVVIFHDPNPTALHRRLVVDRTGRVPATIDRWMSPDALHAYFGPAPAGRMAHVIVPTPDELDGTAFLPGARPRNDPERRTHCDHAGAACTPVELNHRLGAGLLDGMHPRLMRALERCKGRPGEAVQLLRAEDFEGAPGLFVSMYAGEVDAVREMLAIAVDAARAGLLDRQGLFTVLQAQRTLQQSPSLAIAMQAGRMETVCVWRDAVLAAARAGLITREQLRLLFEARSGNGVTGLYLAALGPHAEAARALTDGFLTAVRQGLLPRSALPGLLRVSNAEDLPGLITILAAGRADRARILIDAAFQAASAGLLDSAALRDLLMARSAGGPTALDAALHGGHAEAAALYVTAAQRAASEGWLSDDDLQALLLARATDGVPALCRAAHAGRPALALDLLSRLDAGARRAVARGLSAVESVLLLEDTRAAALAATGPAANGAFAVWLQALLLAPMTEEDRLRLLLPQRGQPGPLDRLASDPELMALLLPLFEPWFARLARSGDAAAPARAVAPPRGLVRALMEANAGELVAALARSFAGPPAAAAQDRARWLLDWDPQDKTSSLSRAMVRGNVLAVQAWLQAVLALPLDAATRRALLQGLPATGAGFRPRSALRHAQDAAQTGVLVAWARIIARQRDEQLALADRRALLRSAGREYLGLATATQPAATRPAATEAQAAPAAPPRPRRAW